MPRLSLLVVQLHDSRYFVGIVREIGRAQSELQSPDHLVCRLLLEKKKNCYNMRHWRRASPADGRRMRQPCRPTTVLIPSTLTKPPTTCSLTIRLADTSRTQASLP